MELHTLVRLGEVQRAEAALDAMDEKERESPETRTTVAVLRLAQEDPEGAREALEPIIEDAVRGAYPRVLSTQVLLLSAIAGDAVRDPGASGRALESALDLAEADGVVVPFLLHPAPALLERHQRHHTSHASLVGEIRGLLAGRTPASLTGPEPLDEALSDSEMRVLRYLPSNLSAPEISDELYLSVSTIKTHIQHIYAKLGVHRRTEAVERARALGLLAPSSLGTHSPSPGARPAIHSNGMRTTHPRRSEPGPP